MDGIPQETIPGQTYFIGSITLGKEGGRMRIGFVGAGKVGFTLGKYMSERNVCVSGYCSRSEESAKEAAEFTHTKYYRTLKEIIASSDALFLTVPDGAVEEVWKTLKQYPLEGRFICHASGALSSAVFSEINQMGAYGYSIHPLFAIHSRHKSYKEISQAHITIEGDERYIHVWRQMFEGFGNPVHLMDAKQKVRYHAAAVFASNLVTGLYEMGSSLLLSCGFTREDAGEALAPLFTGNALSVAEKGTDKALTGPVERGDVATVLKHLEALTGSERNIYIELSKVLIKIAERRNPGRDYSELLKILERNGKEDEKHSYNI